MQAAPTATGSGGGGSHAHRSGVSEGGDGSGSGGGGSGGGSGGASPSAAGTSKSILVAAAGGPDCSHARAVCMPAARPCSSSVSRSGRLLSSAIGGFSST